MLLVWIVAAIFFFLTSFAADYCANSTDNLLTLTNLQNQDVAVYYVSPTLGRVSERQAVCWLARTYHELAIPHALFCCSR